MAKKLVKMFEGRIGRAKFAGNILIAIIIIGILNASIVPSTIEKSISTTEYIIAGIVIVFVFLFLISNNIRRRHDMNRSGWFSILNFIPYVGIIAFLVQLFAPGTKGENKYE